MSKTIDNENPLTLEQIIPELEAWGRAGRFIPERPGFPSRFLNKDVGHHISVDVQVRKESPYKVIIATYAPPHKGSFLMYYASDGKRNEDDLERVPPEWKADWMERIHDAYMNMNNKKIHHEIYA